MDLKNRGNNMEGEKYITVHSNKKDVMLNINTILYITMKRNIAEIHVLGCTIYKVRMTLMELQ